MWNRTRVGKFLAIGGLFAFLVLAVSWVIAGRLASPPRRALEAYHEEALLDPLSRGLKVEALSLRGGKIPVLVLSPVMGVAPGERGAKLRKQLGGSIVNDGTVRGLLVMLHGRHGRKEDLLAAAERFCAVGFICALPDLPAHGESPLKTVQFGIGEGEKSLSLVVAKEVAKERGYEELPRFLWGMSMGGSFAVHALAEDPEAWQAAVIVSSFDALEGVIEDRAGRIIGLLEPIVRRFTITRGGADIRMVRPVDRAAEVLVPVLIAHGDEDSVISISRGRALFAALGSSTKEWETVEGGTHQNVLITPEPLYARMAEWLLKAH